MTKSIKDQPIAKSDKATSPRAGGPPRWLVAVLVLAIGVGIGFQTRPEAKPRIDSPESQPLGIEHALQLTSVWPNAHSLLFAEHSLAHDPVTDHFWIVARNHFNSQRRLEVAASLDGGQTLQPPVDVMPLLPALSNLQAVITYGPDQALYLAVMGMTPKQGQQVGVLRSTDEGATWTLWWHRSDNGYRVSVLGFQMISWNNQLVLLYSAQKSGAPGGLFAEILQTDGTATSPQLIAADPPGDERDIQHVLATPDALHLLATHGGGSDPRRAVMCGLSAAGEVLPLEEIPIEHGHKLVDAALLGDADGDPVVLVKLDTPTPGIVELFAPTHPSSQVSDPRVPTHRYHWNAESLLWNLQSEGAGPAVFMGMKSTVDGLLLSMLVHHNAPRQGFFIDGLAADGHWSDRWELEAPPNTWYAALDTLQLNDGRLVILGTETQSTTNIRHDVLLITEPLTVADATKQTNGSPSETP